MRCVLVCSRCARPPHRKGRSPRHGESGIDHKMCSCAHTATSAAIMRCTPAWVHSTFAHAPMRPGVEIVAANDPQLMSEYSYIPNIHTVYAPIHIHICAQVLKLWLPTTPSNMHPCTHAPMHPGVEVVAANDPQLPQAFYPLRTRAGEKPTPTIIWPGDRLKVCVCMGVACMRA